MMRLAIQTALLLMLSGCLLLLSACAGTAATAKGPGAQCPLDRSSGGMFCADIVTYARDPSTGNCCRYESLCSAPPGWKTYSRKGACEAAGEAAE